MDTVAGIDDSQLGMVEFIAQTFVLGFTDTIQLLRDMPHIKPAMA